MRYESTKCYIKSILHRTKHAIRLTTKRIETMLTVIRSSKKNVLCTLKYLVTC